jgi:hypothetical protein
MEYAILFAFLVVLTVLFSWQVFLVRRAFEFATNDLQWITPSDPWADFWFSYWKRGKWLVAGLFLVCLIIAVIRFTLYSNNIGIHGIIFFAVVMSIPLMLFMTQFCLLMIFTPFIRNRVGLIALTAIGSFFLMLLFSFALQFILP